MTLCACKVRSGLQQSDASVRTRDGGADAAPDVVDSGKAPNDTLDAASDAGAAPRCILPDGIECDLVRQCGCDEGETCQGQGSSHRPRCGTPGPRPAGASCDATSECPAAHTCDRGSCRRYCAEDADCKGGACLPAAAAGGKLLPDVKVCWQPCQRDSKTTCADGTTCRSTKTPYGDPGDYCVAPFDPCPTIEDGVCDEAKGTGACAKGTDTKDCNCDPRLPGTKCDPVAQCGCDGEFTCQAMLLKDERATANISRYTAACIKAGSKPLGQACNETHDCQQGSFCHVQQKVCTRYCGSDADCGDGACLKLPNPDDPKLGVCLSACDRQTGAPCAKSAACVHFEKSNIGPAKTGDFCWSPQTSMCPKDGKCDEPEGTGLCAEGADSADCCKPPAAGGECDPVSQCGCEAKPGTQCQHLPYSATTACMPAGTGAPWGRCDDETPGACPPGYACSDRVCRKYCADDCGGAGNLCVEFNDREGKALEGVGACFMGCDFSKPNVCPNGLVCARFNPMAALCIAPYPQCLPEFIGNNQCDDTREGGSRLCELGSDPDCG